MERSERKIKILEAIRWMGILPSIIIYLAINGLFPNWLTVVITVGFVFGFLIICNSEKKRVLCDDIVKDIRGALKRAGHKDAVFEVKLMKIGIVIRVYLIRARQTSAICSKSIVSSISKGWYKRYVCATQIVDLDNESDVKEAQLMLNEDLWADIRKKAGKGRENKNK